MFFYLIWGSGHCSAAPYQVYFSALACNLQFLGLGKRPIAARPPFSNFKSYWCCPSKRPALHPRLVGTLAASFTYCLAGPLPGREELLTERKLSGLRLLRYVSHVSPSPGLVKLLALSNQTGTVVRLGAAFGFGEQSWNAFCANVFR